MKFRLKEGWSEYLVSGFLIGMFFALVTAAIAFQDSLVYHENVFITLILAVVALLMSIAIFLAGCMVNRQP